MSESKQLKPITKKVIWLFAIGQLGWSLMSAILTNFIESFYQPDDVSVKEGMIYFIPQGRVILGIFTIIGGIYAIGRVFDAITDPWIGNLSDKSKDPKGRRIPFMKKAAIPLALITIMVYICPTAGNPVASKLGTNGVINAIWVLIMMLLFYLFMTIYCTPYNALIAELSRDEKGENVLHFDAKTVEGKTNVFSYNEKGEVTSFTTDNNGYLYFEGLDEGTYYLTEVKAPDGYNKLTSPIKVVITSSQDNDATDNVENPKATKTSTVKYNADAKYAQEKDVTAEGGLVAVINNAGSALPTTGGMGTTILYVAGAILVIAGAAVLVIKKRHEA